MIGTACLRNSTSIRWRLGTSAASAWLYISTVTRWPSDSAEEGCPLARGGGHVQAQMIQLNGLGVHSGFKRIGDLFQPEPSGNQGLSDKHRFKPPQEFPSIAGTGDPAMGCFAAAA